MKIKLLTKEKERKARQLAKEYYSTIRNKKFENLNRLCGVEIEFSIIDDQGFLKPNLAKKISRELARHYVVTELGSYQIEINRPPVKLSSLTFHKLYKLVQLSRKKLEKSAKKYNAKIAPIGLPFYLEQDLFQKKSIFTKKVRHLTNAKYFGDKNKKGADVCYKKGGIINLPGASGLTVINELHIHLQALDVDDLIRLFNYSQMLAAPFVSLGANSGITNGKVLKNMDSQIEIFEKSEGLFDGLPGIPRAGLYPRYIKSIDEFFKAVFSFKPLYYPKNEDKFTAFDLMVGIYYAWVRIQHSLDPKPHFRIEFRPLSTQPTIVENIALAEFYVKTLCNLIDNKVTLIPEKYLIKNFKESMKNGMNASLYWNVGDKIKKIPVQQVLQSMLNSTKNGEFLHLIAKRIKSNTCPAQKLINETKEVGCEKAIERYLKSFRTEKPYI